MVKVADNIEQVLDGGYTLGDESKIDQILKWFEYWFSEQDLHDNVQAYISKIQNEIERLDNENEIKTNPIQTKKRKRRKSSWNQRDVNKQRRKRRKINQERKEWIAKLKSVYHDEIIPININMNKSQDDNNTKNNIDEVEQSDDENENEIDEREESDDGWWPIYNGIKQEYRIEGETPPPSELLQNC